MKICPRPLLPLIALPLVLVATGCGKADAPQVEHSKDMAMQGGKSPSDMLHELMMRPMQSMDMSGNVDKDFATMMAEHHQQAVDMVKIELESGQNPELKAMAQKMADQQTSERKKLLEIAGGLPDASQPSDASDRMHMVMMQPMSNMSVSGNVDKDFATMMAEHHEMAVKMAEIEIASGSHPELKAMARKMKDDQAKEKADLLRIAGSL